MFPWDIGYFNHDTKIALKHNISIS
jgi:hypothetical protein